MNFCDKSGNCSRCGECCAAALPITKAEDKRIKEYISKNNIGPEFFQNDESINLQCCFYDRTNKMCKIYEVRPSICRTFKCNKSIMRLLFYDDPRSLVARIIYFITNGTMQCNKEQFDFVRLYLASHGQEELSRCIVGEFSDK